jgi:nucleoside recognition membrane protein YjiH
MNAGDANFISATPVLLLGVLLVGFVIYCWVDIIRTEKVKHLPKWKWAIICAISVPLGGILYLTLGKNR